MFRPGPGGDESRSCPFRGFLRLPAKLGPEPRVLSAAPGPRGWRGLLVVVSCAWRAPSFGPSTHPELGEGQRRWGNFGVLSWRCAEVWGSISVLRGLVRGPLGLGARLEHSHQMCHPPNLSGIISRVRFAKRHCTRTGASRPWSQFLQFSHC